jgi:23S rRNA pseudouridine2605 synthase
VRINQFLARSGVASRRNVEELILNGRVLVNGKITTDLFTQIDTDKDRVEFDGRVIVLPKHRYYLLNKPAGYMVTKFDPHAEKTIFELLPPDDTLFAAGRLDKETRGLIVITNDGVFGQKLVHPTSKIQKEYLVKTDKQVSSESLDRLKNGVMLDTRLARAVEATKEADGRIKVVLEEGRNRIVRRMFSELGYSVTDLQRIRIGSIHLGEIKEGSWRELTETESKI